jgi:iron complex outermembrane recepter protein
VYKLRAIVTAPMALVVNNHILGGILMKKTILVLLGAAFLPAPVQLFAADDSMMEEIVVTATKREVSIQDVPIAVSAFSGEDLEARGVQDLYGLQEVSPSISVYSSNSTSNGGTLRIRGVGTTGNNPGLEAAVGTFIDGVYRSRAGLAFSDLVDVERVEILRGPQGTLFGKNTSAGALQIITKKPSFEKGTMLALTAGDYGALRVQGSTTGALIDDSLAFRLSFNYNERDGYYENDITSDAYDTRDRYTIKAKLLWQGDNWENLLSFDYTDKQEDCCPANFQYMNLTVQATSATTRGALNLGVPPGVVVNSLLTELGRPEEVANFPSEDNQVGLNFDPFEEIEDWGIQNEFTWDFNDLMTLKSITAYREFDVSRGQDIDFSGADILRPQFTEESFENFSQEFQLTWSSDNADYLVGAYFYTEDIVTGESIRLATQGGRYLSQIIVGAAFGDFLGTVPSAPFGTTRGSGAIGTYDVASGSYIKDGAARTNFQEGDGYFADYSQEARGWSVFTHNTYRLNDQWELSLGLRYSSEEKDALTVINGVAPVVGTERDMLAAMLNDEFNEDHCNGLVFIGAICNNVSWTDDETENEWTGTIQVSYAYNDDINLYGSISRGYKAGGFNLDQQAIEMDIFAMWLATGGDARFLAPDGYTAGIPQDVLDATGGTGSNGLTQFACGQGAGVANPGISELDCAFFDDDHKFDPEFVDAYELGLKGQFLDGALTANIALFYSDFSDFQLNTFTGTGFLINNINEMIATGVEWESTWNLAPGVYWSFGATYSSAKYGDSLNREGTSEAQLFLEQDYKTLEDWDSLESIEGKQITQAPRWQGSTSLFVEKPWRDNYVYGNLNVSYRGKNNTGSDLDPAKDIPGEEIVNLQVGVRSNDDRWDVQAWARNLTDNQVNTLIFSSVFQSGSFSTFFSAPRMVGVTLRTYF